FKLTKEGFSVTIAKNGQEAMDLMITKPWNLIILDVMMPYHTGWEVLKALRDSPVTWIKSIPVLMLTAKGAQKDISNAAELGAEQYLKKPFDPAELASIVRKMTGA
ncbi:MAG: hypothetical protein A2583_03240, partial [Bdellovibrionales bacterium RIFOXYD1_FULL_53_11]